ncbi:MAG TPA: RNA polymerase sigma factor [Thermoanaerobaculia bacterium]|nr:RNA polymerase sigma factor [Thermoanaerobaculia bacterium]
MVEALGELKVLPFEVEEARLVERLRAGDRRAFEDLYRRHLRSVYGLACRLAGDRAEAEELTQEVFVRAWESRERFKSPEHLGHWLRRVSINTWLNRVRRRRPETLLPEAEELAEGRSADGAAFAAADSAGGSVARIDLERALALLPPRLRAVVLLFDLYGQSHEEIAHLLEMTPGSSKVQLHRARRRLKEVLR